MGKLKYNKWRSNPKRRAGWSLYSSEATLM